MIGQIIGVLLFWLAMSGPTGFAAVGWLVRIVRWFDMKILGMDYQQFWFLAGTVWIVLRVADLIIQSSISSTLRGIHDELKRLNGTSCQRIRKTD